MMYVEKGGKRRYRRWVLEGRLSGWIGGSHEAAFLNLSLGGALVEHANMMLPGGIAFVTFMFQGHQTALKCRVVHSQVYSYAVSPSEERDLVYRTGLEFLGVSDASAHLIEKTIESYRVAA